ncbi:hypothetical protein CEXT_304221, partial [Caerostris extrusa]
PRLDCSGDTVVPFGVRVGMPTARGQREVNWMSSDKLSTEVDAA